MIVSMVSAVKIFFEFTTEVPHSATNDDIEAHTLRNVGLRHAAAL